MIFKRFRGVALLNAAILLAFNSLISSALAGSTVSIAADTAVLLTGPGTTLILAGGSSLVSYSVDTTTLTLNLGAESSVTVKSNSLYTLTNSQSLSTKCSASPAYSYVTFAATGPAAVTVTPTTTVACSNTAPVISAFSASPAAITSGQSSVLSWSVAGADTVSIDKGLGSQSNASSSSATVSPTQTTTYTITAVNYIGTTTAQTTVTVTSSSGGGEGGSTINPPVVNSFSASPTSISAGQSSTLSWSLTGASKVSISPDVGTSSLNTLSGTAAVTPASTTIYTLVASNAYGQSVTASTTVSVLVIGPDQSSQASEPTSTPEAAAAPTYCLVNNAGTFSLILSGIRHGIVNPGLLYTYGYSFGDAVKDTPAYQNLPSGDLLGPEDGALVKAPGNPTVYLISGSAKHGFVSAKVFTALGYKFTSVLTIPAPQLDPLAVGSIISDASARHLRGNDISDHGAVYFLGHAARYPYPSVAVYNTWNLHNDFSRVVPANAADLSIPLGPVVTARSICVVQ